MQNDGDLWSIFWEVTLVGGPQAHCIAKVKGHAKQLDIDQGRTTPEDKTGNDKADEGATKGYNMFSCRNAIKWIAKRHGAYISLVRRIQAMIIPPLKVEKEEKGQADQG